MNVERLKEKKVVRDKAKRRVAHIRESYKKQQERREKSPLGGNLWVDLEGERQ